MCLKIDNLFLHQPVGVALDPTCPMRAQVRGQCSGEQIRTSRLVFGSAIPDTMMIFPLDCRSKN